MASHRPATTSSGPPSAHSSSLASSSPALPTSGSPSRPSFPSASTTPRKRPAPGVAASPGASYSAGRNDSARSDKRVRQALDHGNEALARELLREHHPVPLGEPPRTREEETELLQLIRDSETWQGTTQEDSTYAQQEIFDEDEELEHLLTGMDIAGIQCPVCVSGTIVVREAFECVSCRVRVQRFSATNTLEDLRERLSEAYDLHASRNCVRARPRIVPTDPLGGLRFRCDDCGADTFLTLHSEDEVRLVD